MKTRERWTGIRLIFLTALLNFHIPHFLFETRNHISVAENVLELVFLANVLGAILAAIGIYRSQRWGWLMGVAVAVFSFLLWLAQETIGLPGLPQEWLEPSRIVSLMIEVTFVIVARNRVWKTSD